MGVAFLYGQKGGGAGYGSTLTVTAPSGSTVTISKDDKSYTKTIDSNGTAVFTGLGTGTWQVHLTDGVKNVFDDTIIVSDYGITMNYNTLPDFTYDGDYEILNDDDTTITESPDNWKIRFLTSGTLTFSNLRSAENGIDVFLVGGGGRGGSKSGSSPNFAGGGGGGGGYTKTVSSISVEAGVGYSITIGGSGGATSATFNTKYTASAGSSGSSKTGGNGGSGGGGGAISSADGSRGGSNGASGGSGSNGYGSWKGGSGSGTTTREFGEETGRLYAGGGGGGGGYHSNTGGVGYGGGGGAGGGAGGGYGNSGTTAGSGKANTGGGGGGAGGMNGTAGDGGSGVVVIRNARG